MAEGKVDVDVEWVAFWASIAHAATEALGRLEGHERAGEALFATNAARVAAGLPSLQR